MATVTKLKAEINNKNLPILTANGELSNYYFGMFINKLSEIGYSISSGEKTALGDFIDNAISKGYIDYIQYMMPFIGDSEHPFAGAVPLVDNVDNYRMSEYDGVVETYNDMFTYDTNGKIKNLHNSSTTAKLKTPVTFLTQKKGISFFVNGKFDEPTEANFLTDSDVVDVSGTNYYVRTRYYGSGLGVMQRSNKVIMPSLFNNNFPSIMENSYNANIGIGLFVDNNETFKYWGFVQYSTVKDIDPVSTPSSMSAWPNVDYGKYSVGRKILNMYVNALVFVEPTIPTYLQEHLSNDLFTLVNALGRN